VATATACALLGLECTVYMGAVDAARQRPNLLRMELLGARVIEIGALRAAGRPTVPSTIGRERATNPFVRAGSVAEFASRRAAKDGFRG